MRAQYLKLIAELDISLGLMRESWLEATGAKRSRWMGLINDGLDERLRLMRLRDGKETAAA